MSLKYYIPPFAGACLNGYFVSLHIPLTILCIYLQSFMKNIFTLFLFFTLASTASAQTWTVRGSVKDTLNDAPLSMASVVLIRSSDSVIAGHGRSNPDGAFTVKLARKGKYFLRITFPGFADYIDNINLTKTETDLGLLPMVSKSHLLQEFVLTQQISAIKIKGDTTEYMADSFKVKEGANVEDLLKKLPGIQVDKNGQIVAQGETVERVLVDGEEFFSDDPKVVTRGLQADAVKKVQVFDKKSDQAEFSGIDDGQKTKTINLELKEEKKKGYFGKADAGGGTDGYFQNQAMINAFRRRRQFSAFGIASATDKAGLGWQDNDKFGSGNGTTQITDDGTFISSFSSADDDISGWNGKYTGEGLPKTWTAGAHYADKWQQDKQHLTANYRFARQNVDINGLTESQYSLPDDSLRVNAMTKNQFSTGDRHGADLMYDWKIDSLTSLKVTASSGDKTSHTYSDYHTINYYITNDAPDTSINDRTITGDGKAFFLNSDFLLRKKFAKKGRTFSLDGKENYKQSSSDGILSSILEDTATITTKQHKLSDAGTLAFSAKATYTEPLTAKVFAEISYGLTVNNSTASNKSYDIVTDPNTGLTSENINNIFSSDYTFNILSNAGGLNFRIVNKKTNISFGSDVSKTDYVQIDHMHNDSERTYSFLNLFPKASLQYRFGKQTSFNLSYQGSTQQPSITQIQPLRQNTDPLNITIGNPYLKQQFTNMVSARFNDFKILQSRYLWANATFSSISNAISTKQTTYGATNVTEYINVNGNYTGGAFAGYGFKISGSDFMLGAQVNGSLAHINNIVNDKNNTSTNTSYSFGPYLNYDKENKFEFNWNPQVTYNNNISTNNLATVSYYTFNNDLSGSVQLPAKFTISTSVRMMFRQKTTLFNTNNNVIKWDAYVEKKFLKNGQLAVRASVFDMLNQNLGFSRTAQGNVITQNSYNSIRRYGMLNVIWNFTHTPAGAPQSESSAIIINN